MDGSGFSHNYIRGALIIGNKFFDFYSRDSWDMENGEGPVDDTSMPGGTGSYYEDQVIFTGGKCYLLQYYTRSGSYQGILYQWDGTQFQQLTTVPLTASTVKLVGVNGIPYIMNYYNSSTIYKYQNGALTQLSITTAFYNCSEEYAVIEYQNKAYINVIPSSSATTVRGIMTFDGNSFATVARPSDINSTNTDITSFAVHNNALYALYLASTSGNSMYKISKFNGSTWVNTKAKFDSASPWYFRSADTFVTNEDKEFVFLGPGIGTSSNELTFISKIDLDAYE